MGAFEISLEIAFSETGASHVTSPEHTTSACHIDCRLFVSITAIVLASFSGLIMLSLWKAGKSAVSATGKLEGEHQLGCAVLFNSTEFRNAASECVQLRRLSSCFRDRNEVAVRGGVRANRENEALVEIATPPRDEQHGVRMPGHHRRGRGSSGAHRRSSGVVTMPPSFGCMMERETLRLMGRQRR